MRSKLAAILVIVLGAGARLLHAAPEPAANTTPSAAPAAPAANGSATPSPATPAANGTAAPLSPALNGNGAGCGGCCQRGGSCLHRLIEWATYCPKERLGCCRNICNSCQYKGSVPLYLYVGKICQEAPYVRPTFPPPTCCHGCKSCGGCKNCTTAAPCCGK
jgi:hypothetical protein